MQLANIDIGKLSVSALNMRHAKKAPDVSDILPSIRARGIVQPLLVRPVADDPDRFEIVAGRRRWFAANAVIQEGGDIEPLPCAIMAPGDDAAALEASLIENIARLDPDEVTQWRTFTRLVAEGRTAEDISATFGVTELKVKQVLALGNLLPRIRALYAHEAINAATVRHLTLASKQQQKDWLALLDDPKAHAPLGQNLKAWLFGGPSISTKTALFPLDRYCGQIVCDLFGEERYFTDTGQFWALQNQAIAARRDALREAGWNAVVVLEPGARFALWEHEKTPMKKGGKVFIAVRVNGEIEVHEGYLPSKEARRARALAAKGVDAPAAKAERPETTSGLQDYIDLHRHAAVRAVLADQPAVALRLMVAHAIAGSVLWRVEPEAQRTSHAEVAKSVKASTAEARFDAARRAVLPLLDVSPDKATLTGGHGDGYGVVALFARLLALSDDDVLRVIAVVMGETLPAGSAAVEAAGVHLGVEMKTLWRPDDALFELVRDREVANAMLGEVAGQAVADSNLSEKVKVQKKIICDHLDGANGRPKAQGWIPAWLRFPVAGYTRRPFATRDRWAKVAPLFAEAASAPAPRPIATA